MALILLIKWVKKLVRKLIYDQMKIVWRNVSLANFFVHKSYVDNLFLIIQNPHPLFKQIS